VGGRNRSGKSVLSGCGFEPKWRRICAPTFW
jgi:hypothetical protein